MKKVSVPFLVIFLIILTGTQKGFAAFRIHTKPYITNTPANISNTGKTDEGENNNEESLEMPGHHGGGHHGHGGHFHHAYRSHGHFHHYSEHFHHYHYHYHIRHQAWVGWNDYAGLSIFFDIFCLFPLGILFGGLGMRGDRRGVATAGLIIGFIELAILVALIIVFL